MTPIDRFERRLPSELHELAAERTPDYLDDLLTRTAATRQRPRWAFPERWLPMTIALRRPVLAPPMRLLAVGLTLLLAILAVLAVGMALSSPRPLPATIATEWHNGLIAYDANGEIFAIDSPDGKPRVLIGGPEIDSEPDWSPDGSRILFWRADGDAGLMVAHADGTNAIKVATDSTEWHRWSPDGSRIAVSVSTEDRRSVAIANADGSGVETLDLGMNADEPTWHPDGNHLLFRGTTDAGIPGLYTVDLASHVVTGPLVTIDPATPLLATWGWDAFFFDPSYSPDGSKILYGSVVDLLAGQDPDLQNARVRMVDADGRNDAEVAFAGDSWYETAIGWAPDGTRYALRVVPGRPDGARPHDEPVSVVIASADDSDATAVTQPAPGWADGSIWSPDGATLLAYGGGHSQLVDAATGATTSLPWGTQGSVDWQPVAP